MKNLYTNMSKEDKQKLIEHGKINVKTVWGGKQRLFEKKKILSDKYFFS